MSIYGSINEIVDRATAGDPGNVSGQLEQNGTQKTLKLCFFEPATKGTSFQWCLQMPSTDMSSFTTNSANLTVTFVGGNSTKGKDTITITLADQTS